MCLYYLERSKDGMTGADLARVAGVTRAAVSRTLAHLEEGGFVEVDDSGDAAVKYRAPVRLTTLGGESMNEADRIIREVLDTTGKAMGVEQREQMYSSLRTILNTLARDLRPPRHLLPINNCIVPFERVYRAGALLPKFPARDLRKKGFAMSVRIITDSASDMSPVEHPLCVFCRCPLPLAPMCTWMASTSITSAFTRCSWSAMSCQDRPGQPVCVFAGDCRGA